MAARTTKGEGRKKSWKPKIARLPQKSLYSLNEVYLATGSQELTIAHFARPRKVVVEEPEATVDEPQEEAGRTHRIFRMSHRKKYKAQVWKLTEQQPLHLLPNIEKRAFRGWHVDHVLSIMEGYRLGLPAETIAHISNLRMIPAKENMDKGVSTVFTNLFNE